MLYPTSQVSFLNRYLQSEAQKNDVLVIESGVTTSEQIKEIIGHIYYDDRYTTDQNINNAISKGFFCPGKNVILRRWVLSLPNGELRIPDHVTLENCIVTSGRVIFSQGVCFAFGEDAVVIANGWNATAIAHQTGAYAIAAAPFSRAVAATPGTFIIATVPGALTIKNVADAQETTYEDFQRLVQRIKQKADTEKDSHAAYQFALINLSEFYQAMVSIDTALDYLKMASENGYVDATYQLGMAYFQNSKVVQNFALAEDWFNQADDEGHQHALYRIGEMYSSHFYKIDDLGDRYLSYSAIANECYKLCAERGDPLALEKVQHYESDNVHVDRILFRINLPNRIGSTGS